MIQSGLVRYHDDLVDMLAPIDTITPAPWNYNNGDVDAIAESIQANGMYRPVVVQKSTGNIIAGNHTWYACKQLDADTIPVVYVDVDNDRATRIMVADNRTAQLAMPDNGLLLELLNGLDAPTHGTGYDNRDIERLLRMTAADGYMQSDWKTTAAQTFYDDSGLDPNGNTDPRAHHVIHIKTETPETTAALFTALGIDYDPDNPRRVVWYPPNTPHFTEPEVWQG